MSTTNSIGQISQNPDKTIIGVAALCCYNIVENSYDRNLISNKIDSIQFIEGRECPLNVRCSAYSYDFYALFTNVDSTEFLIGVQAPGLNYGDFGSLIIIPVCENNKKYLLHPQCIHLDVPHFVTENGVQLDMTLNELLAIKGDKYSINENGDISYSYISPISKADPEAYEYCIEHNKGDHILDVVIEDGVVVLYALLWEI